MYTEEQLENLRKRKYVEPKECIVCKSKSQFYITVNPSNKLFINPIPVFNEDYDLPVRYYCKEHFFEAAMNFVVLKKLGEEKFREKVEIFGEDREIQDIEEKLIKLIEDTGSF